MINTDVDGSSKSDNNADNFDYFFHHIQYFEWMFYICTVRISLCRDNLYVNLYMMCLMYRIVYKEYLQLTQKVEQNVIKYIRYGKLYNVGKKEIAT